MDLSPHAARLTSLWQTHRFVVVATGLVTVVAVATAILVVANHSSPKRDAQASSHASGLPTCDSPTANGCDRSKLQTGSGGSPGCKGIGPGTITASPISLSDLVYIQPMGLMVGGHVTPIDHGYFYIKGAFTHPTQQAAVYAPLDGVVTRASRTIRQGDPAAKADHPATATYDDDSLSIDSSCTFRVRFSNLVRFAGPLAQKLGDLQPNQNVTPGFAVKAGELIGYTGMPTANGIDVWVENNAKTLKGFINSAQYAAAESWKTHMVDFFDYTKEPLKSQLLALDERDASPRWGKIDYDIDGKLVGNWFRVGTGGYGGGGFAKSGGYWQGHLSVVPDGNDPSQTDVSFGNYQGQAQQFAVVAGSPNPANVDQATGLVKYELGKTETYSADTGQPWNGQAYAPHIRTQAGPTSGTVLLQLTAKRSLKMEIFPGKTAAQVAGFDSAAQMFER